MMMMMMMTDISESDAEFGDVLTVPPDKTASLPSERIDLNSLSHLSEQQRSSLLPLIDEFKECFSNIPGLCTVVTHAPKHRRRA